MTTVKDLLENEELAANLVVDLDGISEDTEVFYAVWALGYSAEEDCTDDEVLLGEFTDAEEAVKYAEAVTLEHVDEMGYGERDKATAYFSIAVETVIADPDDEDGGTMNINTIYSRDLQING